MTGSGQDAPELAAGSTSRASLTDTTHCPGCGRPLAGPRCDGCGIDLSGAQGQRLMQLSLQAAALLAERDAVLAGLRSRVTQAPRGPADMPVAPPSAPGRPPAQGLPVPSPSLPPQGPPKPSLWARIGVQGFLVALGALLVAVAGIVFLVFSWERLTLGGRALVIAVITGAAMGGAAWLRPRLAETAEGIGAIGAVLVLADAWAVRATGLFGTDRWNGYGYAFVAGAVCTAVLLAWGVAGRVRAGTVTAALAGPASVVLGGVWIAQRFDDRRGFWVATGLLAAAALTLCRRWAPAAWRAERTVLNVLAVGTWLAAVVWVAALTDQPGRAAAVLSLAAVVAVGQVVAAGDTERWRHVAWSFAAGAVAALAAAPAAYQIAALLELDRRWLLAAAPAGAAAIALGVDRLGGAGRPLPALRHRYATRAARGASCVLALPAAVVAVALAQDLVVASLSPWRVGPGVALAEVLSTSMAADLASGGAAWVPGVAAGLGLLALGLLLAVARPPRWSWVAAPAAGAAALTLPLLPPLPIAAVVATLLLLGLGAAAVSVRGPGDLIRWTALAVAVIAGTEAVLASWTARSLSVPVTLLGIGALLAACRIAAERFRPVLIGAAVLATTVDVGAVVGLLGHDVRPRMQAVSIAGSVLAGLLGALPARGTLLGRAILPARGTVAPERFAGALVGVATAVVAGLSSVAADRERPATYTTGSLLVLLALLGALLAMASRPCTAGAPAGRFAPVLGAAAAPLVAVVTADGLVRRLAVGSSTAWYEVDNRSLVAASAVLALCGLALGVIGIRGPGDRRRVGAEIGSAVPLVWLALRALASGPSGSGSLTGGIGQPSWLVLLLLGVGATAAAIPADRRRVGWLGWALLSLSSAYRLARSDVGTVEAYTVPPALALLAVSGLRLRTDRSTHAWSTLVPGLTLLVVPSVLACAREAALRPALLIGLGALAVGLTRWAGERYEVVLLAVAAVSAGGAGSVRVLRGATLEAMPAWQDVELWSLSAAAVLLAIGVRLLLTRPMMRSWISLAPGLVLLLIPTLVLALGGTPIWRVVWLTVLAGAVVAAGAVRRLQAPVVLGGAVLAVHAIAQLGPWVVRTLAAQPRWLTLAVVGALLLGLGATYERRLRELRAARMQLSSLR